MDVYEESGRAGYDDGGPGIRRLSTDVVIVETKSNPLDAFKI